MMIFGRLKNRILRLQNGISLNFWDGWAVRAGPGEGLPVQAATGGRSGVSVYKAGRSVPLDSAQLDLSRLALPQLGSAGVEKCFEIHVPSSGLKTNKKQKRSKNTFHE